MTNFKSEFKKAYRLSRLIVMKGQFGHNNVSTEKFHHIAKVSGISAFIVSMAVVSLYDRERDNFILDGA